MQLSLIEPLLGGFDDLRSFGEAIQALDRLSELGVGLGSAPTLTAARWGKFSCRHVRSAPES